MKWELNINESIALFIRFSFWNMAFYILQMNAHLEILFQNTYHYVKHVLVTGVFEIFFGIMLLLKRPANWLKQV